MMGALFIYACICDQINFGIYGDEILPDIPRCKCCMLRLIYVLGFKNFFVDALFNNSFLNVLINAIVS